jgi:tryptophanyl-tRNA synthetase
MSPATFHIPETMISTCPFSPSSFFFGRVVNVGSSPRITSFTDPTKKMSKSAPDEFSKIVLTTPPDRIHYIIRRALTDSIPGIYSSPERPGITNLLTILAAFEGKTVGELETEMRDWPMKLFKERLAESIIKGLEVVRARYEQVKGDEGWLERVRRDGNGRAKDVASRRMVEIKRAVGLL